jgi:hypothetical protein
VRIQQRLHYIVARTPHGMYGKITANVTIVPRRVHRLDDELNERVLTPPSAVILMNSVNAQR